MTTTLFATDLESAKQYAKQNFNGKQYCIYVESHQCACGESACVTVDEYDEDDELVSTLYIIACESCYNDAAYAERID